ncbi:TPA: DNA-directed RNA polymerase subunit M [Desulfurococcaceae archaeon]|nr:DNA-directed RNA polymerase subunit M [Desulfurococcaceae archaeon]
MQVVRKDGKVVLKCPRCGYEVEVKKPARIVRAVEKDKHIITTSKVVKAEERRTLTEEEKEMLQDYYRDIFLENFGGE